MTTRPARTITWRIIIVFGLAAALYGSSYWGYLQGLHASEVMASVMNLVAVKSQRECIVDGNQECTRRLNEFMADALAVRLTILKDHGITDDAVAKHVNEYLEWHQAEFPED